MKARTCFMDNKKSNSFQFKFDKYIDILVNVFFIFKMLIKCHNKIK